jgi:hypothetical protein
MLVVALIAVTLAPGSTAPEESKTVPRMLPLSVWPYKIVNAANSRMTDLVRYLITKDLFPPNCGDSLPGRSDHSSWNWRSGPII